MNSPDWYDDVFLSSVQKENKVQRKKGPPEKEKKMG